MSVLGPYVAGIVAASVAYLAFRTLRRRPRGVPLPPGPPRRPIIGNLLDLPTHKPWLTFQKWTEQYGGMIYLEVLGSRILVLGNEESVMDLLDRRVNFAYRIKTPMFIDLLDLGWTLVLRQYGEDWRKQRRLLHANLHSDVAFVYEDTQLKSTRMFISELLATKHGKEVLPGMIRSYFGRTIIKMTYGIDVKNEEDEYITVPARVVHAISEAGVPGKFLVDAIPLLKYVPDWFPGASFKRFAAETRRMHRKMRDAPLIKTKEEMAAGTAPVSVAQRMLEEIDEDDAGAEEMVKDATGNIYLAGADTTVAAVTSFFLAMVVYPEVQHRAQAELDAVVGRDRLPAFSDREHLPYVKAVMSECLRWLPVLPLGVPHMTAEDDTYKGCFIPKGTMVLPIQSALLHNPATYPEPMQFSPERYLTRTSSGEWVLRDDVRDPRNFCFGFGRRACPGTHIAEQSLFASVATVLHTLDVRRSKNANGEEIVPEADVSGGVLSHPLPFDYEIHMRQDAKELVEMCSQ